MKTYVIDGSYVGYLTGVFDAFVRKDVQVKFTSTAPVDLFDIPYRVVTDAEKAKRVQKALEDRIGKGKALDFFRNFLSEDARAWEAGFSLLVRIFKGQSDLLQNFGDTEVLYFSQTLKKVSRERHRMKAFTRFSRSSDGMFFAVIEPDFNVLPLIIDFFQKRYADQSWIIYDTRRDYGIHYDTQTCIEVHLEEKVEGTLPGVSLEVDQRYENLWKSYFQSTNIVERKNMRLHLRHVPKRYWKFLPEKSTVVL
jgi:probable DNA metabolism protein